MVHDMSDVNCPCKSHPLNKSVLMDVIDGGLSSDTVEQNK